MDFTPPFSAEVGVGISGMPTISRLSHFAQHRYQSAYIKDSIAGYLEDDLSTAKISVLYPYLWLAGLPLPARPLHRQRMLLRTIYATESADEHLVWHDSYIFVKPLPEYLMSYAFWKEHLCFDKSLHESACGLLISYAWLICHKTDLQIAIEAGLINKDMEWDQWSTFMMEFLAHVDAYKLSQVSQRYHFGELRLSRLNKLYRVGAAGVSLKNMVHGFMPGSVRYTTFFETNFAWTLAAFVYISVVLSAMQVALGTETGEKQNTFQDFSYFMSMLSMASVMFASVFMLCVWFFLFCYYLSSTIIFCKKIAIERAAARANA